MLFYFVFALLLLNTFATKPRQNEPCKDEEVEDFCQRVNEVGWCNYAKTICAKSCKFCIPQMTERTNF
ncbi:hypothetical protein V3C99_006066 [Haemonchus contortus]